MKVVVIADHHYVFNQDGQVFVPSVYGYDYWRRYLSVFEEITVICRGAKAACDEPKDGLIASGPNVHFVFVYDFHGWIDLAMHYAMVKKQVEHALEDCDCAFVRVPSPLSSIAVNAMIRRKKLFACEVVADPAESYDTVPFAGIVQGFMARHCSKACINANGVTYVTREALQKKYPSRARLRGESMEFFESHYSSVNLSKMFFEKQKDYEQTPAGALKLIHVSNMIDGVSKGHYICLDILAQLQQMQIPARLEFVGDGPEIPGLIEYAKTLGVDRDVVFAGRISSPQLLRDAYLQADILLLPSKTEGLPRCILEGMACGLVCVASDVGGIPEVLESTEIFEWTDSAGMAKRVQSLWKDRFLLKKIGCENRNKARLYSAEVLEKRRNEFYGKVKKLCMEIM